MRRIGKLSCVLFIFLSLGASVRVDTSAQVRPSNDYGILGLSQRIEEMRSTKSVMMIGAHPDDEDSALIAYLARGEHARTAYLSLTRGDGGQNIIGPELFEPLGVIRTEELLQARRLDGAEQYFTRAFDYGFSKTLDEAKSKWPIEVIKCDAVRAIREFRPLVVISRFSGTPADGHGQHQYAGYITPLAVVAAADPQQCTEAGEPWQVLKFYVEAGFADTSPGILRLNTGKLDAILGRSYFEIAMEGRSQHRSQGEGRLELKGDQFSGLKLQGVETQTSENSPFDGLDVSIAGIAKLANSTEEPFNAKLKLLSEAVIGAAAKCRSGADVDIVGDLAKIYDLAYKAEWSTRRPQSKAYMKDLQLKAAAALKIAAGIQIDALTDRETVTPGGELNATLRVFAASDLVSVLSVRIDVPTNWTATAVTPPSDNPQGPFRREQGRLNASYKVTVPKNAVNNQPYWLREPRDGDLFRWPETDDRTMPFSPETVSASVRIRVGDVELDLRQPMQFRYADTSRGEVRRDLNVTPAVSITPARKLVIVPKSAIGNAMKLPVTVTNNSSLPVSGFLVMKIGTGTEWKYGQRAVGFELKSFGEKATAEFDLTVPRGTAPGVYVFEPEASLGGITVNQTMGTVAYPHIQTHRFYSASIVKVVVLDLKSAAQNIGYIAGSGDDVPEAIGQMGMNVTMLEEKDLASGDLSRFKSIVVGIRASETRPDFTANNQRLLEYVRNGGNLIVQYQRGNWTGLAPFPVNTADKQGTAAGSIARVVDENAPVEILAPSHPAFLSPNKITAEDFKGWVQERNAYNIVTFDQRYIPLLESHDAGELPNKGGLVIATVGKGNWVYCSYSFFRQLPAGVPGAYRLFANLLNLPSPGPEFPRIAR